MARVTEQITLWSACKLRSSAPELPDRFLILGAYSRKVDTMLFMIARTTVAAASIGGAAGTCALLIEWDRRRIG